LPFFKKASLHLFVVRFFLCPIFFDI
jgi:hypothetical protein